MDTCIFCKIASGEISAQKTFEDENFIAFLDIHPKTPGHTLLIPKNHHHWVWDLPDGLFVQLFETAKKLVPELKRKTSADYVQLSVVGKDVPHAHVHLIPRKLDDNSVLP
jgi:histidine triad (HIT) family protein